MLLKFYLLFLNLHQPYTLKEYFHQNLYDLNLLYAQPKYQEYRSYHKELNQKLYSLSKITFLITFYKCYFDELLVLIDLKTKTKFEITTKTRAIM